MVVSYNKCLINDKFQEKKDCIFKIIFIKIHYIFLLVINKAVKHVLIDSYLK
jgi:hypothetical protein